MSICVPCNFGKELDCKYVMETTLSRGRRGGRKGGVGAATFPLGEEGGVGRGVWVRPHLPKKKIWGISEGLCARST